MALSGDTGELLQVVRICSVLGAALRDLRIFLTGLSIHCGVNAPPTASQAFVSRVTNELKPCSNVGNVGGQTSARSYST
jgi:hypothetical protein